MADMEAQVEQLQKEISQMAVDKTCLQRQNEALQKVLELRQGQIDTLTELARIHEGPDEVQAHELHASEMTPGLEAGLSVHACRAMSPAAAIAKWKQYVERIASLLIEAELQEPEAPCPPALEQVCCEAGNFARTLAFANPQTIRILLITNFQTGTWDESLKNNTAFWAETVKSIMLSDEQMDKILYLAALLQRSIDRLGVEREALTRRLQAEVSQTVGANDTLSACIKATEILTDLRKNFQTEHEAWTSYMSSVLAAVLTTLQFARFCSKSYPLFPNAFTIAKHIAMSGYVPKIQGAALPDPQPVHGFAVQQVTGGR